MKIAVCTITYKRPEGLARLLNGLAELRFLKSERPTVEFIVVDNDISGAGMKICQKMRSEKNLPIRCVVETRRGISYARNKAIESASDDADFIAFIDDDEVPGPFWLEGLIDAQNKYDSDVVAGHTVPHYTCDVPDWIIRGAFFERENHPTGSRLSEARASNVLIRTKIFKDVGRFDERFSLTGGEDTHFFMRVSRSGYKITWSSDAVVTEWVPGSRMNAGWILRRTFRIGTTDGMIEFDLSPSLITGLIWISRGSWRIVRGLARIPFVFPRGKHMVVKSLQSVLSGAGIIAGIMGVRYREYFKTHGD